MNHPGSIQSAIDAWLANAPGSLRTETGAITATYKSGGTSAKVDLAAYLATRAPATFAAVAKALHAAAQQLPELAPSSLLDIGAGAGSATWAVLGQWPGISQVTLFDNDPRFLKLAGDLATHADVPALSRARYMLGDIAAHLPEADVVVASYVLAERPPADTIRLARNMWAATTKLLLVIEPGTPAGFDRIRSVRTALIADGAHIAAPCTHTNACPMANGDWCHFTARLQRSRTHMHAKQASVPWEDEPFSYVAAVRQPVAAARGRILRPPKINKAGAALMFCAHDGLQQMTVPARETARFNAVRKLNWGDVVPASDLKATT